MASGAERLSQPQVVEDVRPQLSLGKAWSVPGDTVGKLWAGPSSSAGSIVGNHAGCSCSPGGTRASTLHCATAKRRDRKTYYCLFFQKWIIFSLLIEI